MNPLDILMVIIFAYCLIMGFFRGLFREAFAIIGVVAGFYAAFNFYMKLAKYISKWFSDPAYMNLLSFVGIFCCIFVIIGTFGIIVRYLLKIVPFGWLDRAFGGTLGLLRGILIVSVLLLAFTTFLKDNAPVIRNSGLAPHVTLISEQISKFVSKDMKRKYDVKVRILKKSWKTKS